MTAHADHCKTIWMGRIEGLTVITSWTASVGHSNT